MKKIINFRSLGKDGRFDMTFTNIDMTPLSVGDSIDLPSKMSQTGFVRFIPQVKNVFLDTRQGEWIETTTLTGQFLIISREENKIEWPAL